MNFRFLPVENYFSCGKVCGQCGKTNNRFLRKNAGAVLKIVKMECLPERQVTQVNKKEVTPAALRRFPRYYRVLRTMIASGVLRCSSGEIARRCDLSPSAVRADLAPFSGCAKQGYGYRLSKLYPAIGEFLGVNDRFSAVLVSDGLLGEALSQLPIFTVHGIRLLATFSQSGKARADLGDFCRTHQIDLLLTTEPLTDAELALCREVGICGIWNLSPNELAPIEGVRIVQVHPVDSLMQLCGMLSQDIQPKEGDAP